MFPPRNNNKCYCMLTPSDRQTQRKKTFYRVNHLQHTHECTTHQNIIPIICGCLQHWPFKFGSIVSALCGGDVKSCCAHHDFTFQKSSSWKFCLRRCCNPQFVSIYLFTTQGVSHPLLVNIIRRSWTYNGDVSSLVLWHILKREQREPGKKEDSLLFKSFDEAKINSYLKKLYKMGLKHTPQHT